MFGRRRRRGRYEGQSADQAQQELPSSAKDAFDNAEDAPSGPYDEVDAPKDELARLDLGSVRVPVPDGAQLQVEVDPSGPVRAVHVLTPVAQLTVSAFAAPRSGGLWADVASELAEQLRSDGARVVKESGEWGTELVATMPEVTLRFVGVEGPRWLLRGVAAGPGDVAKDAATLLYDMVRETVVVRGREAFPVRTPLELKLPEPIARHIETQQAGQG